MPRVEISMYRGHMSSYKFGTAGSRPLLALAALCFLAFSCLPAIAQTDKDKPSDKTAEKAAPEKADKDRPGLPPLPPDAHVQQSIELNGKTLHYTATVGTLPVRDKEGKEAGRVVFTSYTVEGPNRPVTFAFNGGPGASSVYLNFGAIGPKRIQFGAAGDSASDSARLIDNPGT